MGVMDHMERYVHDAYSKHWTDTTLRDFLVLLLDVVADEYDRRGSEEMADRCRTVALHLEGADP